MKSAPLILTVALGLEACTPTLNLTTSNDILVSEQTFEYNQSAIIQGLRVKINVIENLINETIAQTSGAATQRCEEESQPCFDQIYKMDQNTVKQETINSCRSMFAPIATHVENCITDSTIEAGRFPELKAVYDQLYQCKKEYLACLPRAQTAYKIIKTHPSYYNESIQPQSTVNSSRLSKSDQIACKMIGDKTSKSTELNEFFFTHPTPLNYQTYLDAAAASIEVMHICNSQLDKESSSIVPISTILTKLKETQDKLYSFSSNDCEKTDLQYLQNNVALQSLIGAYVKNQSTSNRIKYLNGEMEAFNRLQECIEEKTSTSP